MILRLDDLVVARSGRRILDGVSIEIAAGTLTAVVGPNGAGKSTLLRALAGLGESSDGDRRRALLAPLSARETVGYLGSESRTDFPLTARECIELATGRAWGDARTARVLALDELLDRSILTLSSGERQRVAFARLLHQSPRAFCLDESFSQLDPEHLAGVRSLLEERRLAGHAAVLVSHDWSFLTAVCDRWVFLKAGRVLASGSSAEVLDDANLAALYPHARAIRWFDGSDPRPRVRFE